MKKIAAKMETKRKLELRPSILLRKRHCIRCAAHGQDGCYNFPAFEGDFTARFDNIDGRKKLCTNCKYHLTNYDNARVKVMPIFRVYFGQTYTVSKFERWLARVLIRASM